MSEDHSLSEPAPVDDGNREFPIPLAHFIALIRGTDNEIWTHFLQKNYGNRAFVAKDWYALIGKHGQEPAHPSVTGG